MRGAPFADGDIPLIGEVVAAFFMAVKRGNGVVMIDGVEDRWGFAAAQGKLAAPLAQ